MNKEEIFELVSESLDGFYELNNILPDHLRDELKILNDSIYKIEKIYEELEKEVDKDEML